MRSSIILFVAACSLSVVACDKDKPAPAPVATNATPAASAPPAEKAATPAPAPAKPAATAAKATKDKPKGLPENKKHAIPKDWEHLADAQKGFGYSLPKGSKHEGVTKDGVDIYMASLAKPHAIETLAVVYKDASKSLDDLKKDAVKVMTSLDQTEVKVEKTDEISADYHLLTMTMLDEKKQKFKAKVLLATDVTDNYLLFVGSPEAEWAANEATVDEIWGSFEMWSGGASGESK